MSDVQPGVVTIGTATIRVPPLAECTTPESLAVRLLADEIERIRELNEQLLADLEQLKSDDQRRMEMTK